MYITDRKGDGSPLIEVKARQVAVAIHSDDNLHVCSLGTSKKAPRYVLVLTRKEASKLCCALLNAQLAASGVDLNEE